MALKDIFTRRRPTQRKPTRDWSSSFTQRDWADLPVYHPRRDED